MARKRVRCKGYRCNSPARWLWRENDGNEVPFCQEHAEFELTKLIFEDSRSGTVEWISPERHGFGQISVVP